MAMLEVDNTEVESIEPVNNPFYEEGQPDHTRTIAAPLVRQLDVMPDHLEEGPRRNRQRHVKHRVAKCLCHLAKAEFGALEPTKVNESVVRAFMLREAKQRKLPPHHLCGILTWAVHFYWLPTPDEMEVFRAECTEGFNESVEEYDKTNYIKRFRTLPAWLPFNRRKAFALKPKSD